MRQVEEILKTAGIAPTPVRLLVLRCLCEAHSPMSMSDLEVKLESVDKSTISRTLSLFKEHRLVHSFNDGSGSIKYEICQSKGHETEDDSHVHFRCEKCGKTICLNSVSVPEISLPEGFVAKESNFVVTGTCNHCSNLS